jgi:hypothetical protein
MIYVKHKNIILPQMLYAGEQEVPLSGD